MENNEQEMEEIPEPWYKKPLTYLIALFLILLLVVWYFPTQAVKVDPEPGTIPTLAEVVPGNIGVNESVHTEISSALISPYDPAVKQVADKISTVGCDGGRICQSKAVFYFVRDRFDYVPDPMAYEYVKTARQSLVSQGGDCDDASVLLANLLGAIGVETRFVFMPGHVYVQARLPEALRRYKAAEDWVNLDATCRNCKFGEIPLQNQNQRVSYLNVY